MSEPSHEFVLGVDIGTTGCKTMAVAPDYRVLAEGFAAYPVLSSRPTYAEQDPTLVVKQTLFAARECLSQVPGAPRAICFGGALHSLVPVDVSDHPLMSALTWADNRSSSQIPNLKERIDPHALYLRTGCPLHPMYPLAKIHWLRDTAPEIFRATRRLVSIKECVTHAWTGEWVADSGVASGSGLLNLASRDWDPRATALVGIDLAQLSPVRSPITLAGELRAQIADELGIPRDTRVVLGGSDAAFSNVGVGALSPAILVVMIGSSGAVRVITRDPMLDADERTWCYLFDESRYLVGGAINNGGLVLRWFADHFVGPDISNAEELLVSEAARVRPGAEGLIFLPFLAGERSPGWNSDARGVLFGLALHHGRQHVARALLESVAYRIRSVLEAVEDVVQPAVEIRASGGFLRSPLWVQILCDVLGRQIRVPNTGNTSALGAALWAWHVCGALDSLDSLERTIPIERVVQPHDDRHALYTQLYDLYRDLYTKLGGPFAAVSRIQSNYQE